MGVCTKERKGVIAEVLMATPCTNSLGGESGVHKHYALPVEATVLTTVQSRKRGPKG